MRPTQNMDTTPARGRRPTALGSDALYCELCVAKGERYARGGNQFVWVLGYPLMRTCRPCSKEMKAIYEGAKDA